MKQYERQKENQTHLEKDPGCYWCGEYNCYCDDYGYMDYTDNCSCSECSRFGEWSECENVFDWELREERMRKINSVLHEPLEFHPLRGMLNELVERESCYEI